MYTDDPGAAPEFTVALFLPSPLPLSLHGLE